MVDSVDMIHVDLYLSMKNDIGRSFIALLPKWISAVLALVEVFKKGFWAQTISGSNSLWIVDWKKHIELSFQANCMNGML